MYSSMTLNLLTLVKTIKAKQSLSPYNHLFETMKFNFVRILLVGAVLFCSLPAWSQWQEILHQTFEVDSIKEVSLDIFGDYEVELWAGNIILTETKVKIDCGNKNVLTFLIEEGRYDLEGKPESDNLLIVSKDKTRNPMRRNDQDCTESVQVRIFIPDDFQKNGNHSWLNPDSKGGEENE